MKKLMTMVVVMALLVIPLFTGCSGKSGSGSTANKEIILMTHIVAGENTALFKKTKAFNDAHPGVTVTINTVNLNDLLNNFTTAAMAGSGPDIVAIDSAGGPIDAAAMGTLQPLNQWLDPVRDNYLQGPLSASLYLGNNYAIPWYFNNAALYYNKKLLNEVGAVVPTTWAELEDGIKRLTAAGYKGMSTRLDGYAIFSYFFQANNPVIDTSGPKPVVTVNNESGKKAWNYYTGFITKYNAFPESFKEATDWDRAYSSFLAGNLGFFLVGDWGYNTFHADPNLDFGITPLPKGDRAATVLGGYMLAMNKNSKNQDLAWEYMRYLTSKPQDDTMLELGRIPARPDADTEPLLERNPFFNVFIDQGPVTLARPAVINLKEVDEVLVDAFKYVLFNQKTPQQALDDMEKALQTLIDANYR
jgi:ABC-type glycerol-3-phosphate transport system substrate-binding protein